MIAIDRQKERYESRKAARLCVACGAPLPDGCRIVTCPICTERARKWRERRYLRLTGAGMCVRCGKRKAEDGKTRCEMCRALDKRSVNAVSQTERIMAIYNERKAQHKCPSCGVDLPPDYKKVRCKGCLKVMTFNVQRMRERRLNAGVCIECGWRKPQEGRKRCLVCSTNMASRKKKE